MILWFLHSLIALLSVFTVPGTAFAFQVSRIPTKKNWLLSKTGYRRVPCIVNNSVDDDNDDKEEVYRRKLSEAKYAIERAESARFQLASPPPTALASRKAKVTYTDAGTMCIELKASGWDTSSLFGGAFSVAWFSAIVPATFTGGGAALFMLPFWAAGGMVAKSSLVDPLTSVSLTIGEFAWSFKKNLGGKQIREKSGATAELSGAGVEVALSQNGAPAQYQLTLYGPDCVLGVGLAETELNRLANAINDHLAQVRVQTAK